MGRVNEVAWLRGLTLIRALRVDRQRRGSNPAIHEARLAPSRSMEVLAAITPARNDACDLPVAVAILLV